MGEQVAGQAGYGWLDGVRADLEAEGYASRGVDIPACAVDAPHIRSRIYWVASDVADADHERRDGIDALLRQDQAGRDAGDIHEAAGDGCSHMADADNTQRWPHTEGRRDDDDGQNARREKKASGRQLGSPADDSHMADADSPAQQRGRGELPAEEGQEAGRVNLGPRGAGPFWEGAVWLTGADGKARRAQPGIPLLAHGIPNRVGKLRAYGNAIVPQVAAEVIGAYMDCAQAWGKKDGNI
jgi:DNA (cytosine-5)-methyltransferase 1